MSRASPSSDALRRVLTQPTGGIAGLVDDLLTVCREQGLQLDWQADRCRMRSFAEDWQEWRDVPLRKTVFRAVLARLAVLCNERNPGSTSPYGGQGEIIVGANPATVFRVVFTNTPGEQRLELTQVGERIMSTPFASATKGDPMLAGLLAELPRLRQDLPGWTEGYLVPALAAFPDDVTDAALATALSNLRKMLRDRADIDPWLGTLAEVGTGEYAGDPHAMTSASKLPLRVELPPDRVRNRTIVEQARQLRAALTRTPAKEETGNPSLPQSKPGAK
jgi:hypothetical protein